MRFCFRRHYLNPTDQINEYARQQRRWDSGSSQYVSWLGFKVRFLWEIAHDKTF